MPRVARRWQNKPSTKFLAANILLLGIASFLNDMSSEMITPILPFFLGSLGASGIVIGIVGGLRDSISSLLKMFFGYISDKMHRRKPFVILGYFTSSVFKFFIAIARGWQQLLALVALERTGKAIRTAPRDAIISESMRRKRGEAFAIHRAFDTAGAITGSIITLLLFFFLSLDFRRIILVSALISFLSLVPLHFVRETRCIRSRGAKRKRTSLSRNLKLFIFIAFVFSLANFSYMFFVLRASDFFSREFSFLAPITLYIFFNIFYAIFSIPFGKLSDKKGRIPVLFLGYLLFSLVAVGFAFVKSPAMLILLFPLYGLVYAIVESVQPATVSDLSAEEERATALGILYAVIGIGALPASIIAGILWQVISHEAAFLYASCLSFIALLLLVIFGPKLIRKNI